MKYNPFILKSLLVLTLSLAIVSIHTTTLGTEDPSTTPTPEETPTATPTPETSPTPEGTPTATPTPETSPTPEGTPTATPTPETSPTPEETPTPTPTPSVTPEEMILQSVAINSTVQTKKNTPARIDLGANFVSGEIANYAITVHPTHGIVIQSGEDLSYHIYTPETDYVGEDSFSFRLESGEYYSNVATVSITIIEDPNTVIPFHYIDMQNHWANYSASHLAARGFIIGEEIGSRYYYYPNKTMTRGEFMLYLLAICESNTDSKISGDVEFADSENYPSWMLEAAKVAYAKKMITGSKDGEKVYLNLNKTITRIEAATMISNVLDDKSSTGNITYKDVGMIPDWGLNAVKNLTVYQIIQGDSTGTFRPNSNLTRGEAAELCYKLLKQLEANQLNVGSGDVK